MTLDQITLLIIITLGAYSGIIFVQARDLLKKQLALFAALFCLFVPLSQVLFGRDFASKSGMVIGGVELISLSLLLFCLPLFILIKDDSKIPQLVYRRHRGVSFSKEFFALIFMSPFLLFLIWYVTDTGYRLSGAFLDHAGDRQVFVDYFYVYYVCCLAVCHQRKTLFVLGAAAFLAHFIAAERMRAFVYILTLGIHYWRLTDRNNLSTAVLAIGFLVASLVSAVRSDFSASAEFNISHFGSVTVSSLYLLDFSDSLSMSQRLSYGIGTVVANLIPSSVLPEGYNLRADIFKYADIPGGGWLSIFLYVIGGNSLIILCSIGISFGYNAVKARAMSGKAHFYAAFLVFVCTCPRWFMYTPFQILKMALYAFVLTIIMSSLLRVTYERPSKTI